MGAVRGIPFYVAVLLCASSSAADWSAFRGPSGDGISTAVNVPAEWSAEGGVAWKVDLPGRNNGSPIVSAGHILLTSAETTA